MIGGVVRNDVPCLQRLHRGPDATITVGMSATWRGNTPRDIAGKRCMGACGIYSDESSSGLPFGIFRIHLSVDVDLVPVGGKVRGSGSVRVLPVLRRQQHARVTDRTAHLIRWFRAFHAHSRLQ